MHTITAIDMLTPVETRSRLQLDEATLVAMVNDGRIAAYRLGGHLRFKLLDVQALAEKLVAA